MNEPRHQYDSNPYCILLYSLASQHFSFSYSIDLKNNSIKIPRASADVMFLSWTRFSTLKNYQVSVTAHRRLSLLRYQTFYSKDALGSPFIQRYTTTLVLNFIYTSLSSSQRVTSLNPQDVTRLNFLTSRQHYI